MAASAGAKEMKQQPFGVGCSALSPTSPWLQQLHLNFMHLASSCLQQLLKACPRLRKPVIAGR